MNNVTEMVPLFVCWNVLIAAMLWDAKEMRVPNAMVIPVLLMGLFLQTAIQFEMNGNWFPGILLWGKQVLMGFGILYLFYLCKALGAGDVKLMSALCGLLSARLALYMTAAALILGAVCGIFHLIWPKVFPKKVHFTYLLGAGYCVALMSVCIFY